MKQISPSRPKRHLVGRARRCLGVRKGKCSWLTLSGHLLTMLTGSLPTHILFLLPILSSYSSPFLTYLGNFFFPNHRKTLPIRLFTHLNAASMYACHLGGGREADRERVSSMLHLHRQVPFWVMLCGHVVGTCEGEEKTHLGTAWYDSPYVVGSGREGVCVCENGSRLVSKQDGAGVFP